MSGVGQKQTSQGPSKLVGFVPEADLQNTVQIGAWITPLGSDGPWLGLFPHG
jgi:hypothetical protein